MKILVTFALFCGSLHVSAATLEVVARETKPILTLEFSADLTKSIGLLTVIEFEKAKLVFEGNEAGIVSIGTFKNEIEVISDREMRAYGWCYSINGLAPDLMPDQVFLKSQKDELKWFYAYSEYKDGNWISQCVPVIKDKPSSADQ